MLVNVEHERQTHMDFYADYCDRNDLFFEKYFRLVRNLDGESVETVNLYLQRMNIILKSKDIEMEIFDADELKTITNLDLHFKKKMFQLSDSIFSYKNFFLPEFYFDPIVFYYRFCVDYLQSLSKIRKGNIIDGGAYIGDSSLILSQMTDMKVIAFEAISENCEKIKKTIELNNINNIEIHNEALGNKNDKVLIKNNENRNWSTLNPYSSREYETDSEISMRTIDDFEKNEEINISLIKLHIEGCEFAALEGAINTIKKYKPALIIHIHHTPNDFWGIKPFIEDLNLGYTFHIVKPINGSAITGTMLIAEVL